ncbi:MAG TPA: hypothetical protein VL294_11480 [Pseudolysinimonas sp.]|jgi:hypothetical protein|nr:hypothetical protein [Pseudolysinimonas sp.]
MRTRDLGPLEFTHADLAAARVELSEFVTLMADRTKERTGIGWEPSPDAPNSWKALKAAWQHSLSTGEPLPIYDGASDSVVFASAEANIAYRFWHDVTHLERRRNFTNAHEIDMASFHLAEAEKHGLERGSLPWRLLHADSVGQTLHWAILREFVLDQRVFVLNVVQFGLEAALLAGMARLGLLAPQVLPFGVDYTTGAVAPKPPTEFTA